MCSNQPDRRPKAPCWRTLTTIALTTALSSGLIVVAARGAAAAEIRVPRDHKTIQAAIDAADAGDTVLVGAGTYSERIRLKPRVTVKSIGDDAKGTLGLKRAEATIIDGRVNGGKPVTGPGVTMAEGSTFDGFTVTGVGEYDDAKWNKHHATQGEQQAHEHIGVPGTAGIAVIGVTHCRVANNIVHHIGYTGIAIMGEAGKRVTPHIVHNVAYRNMGGGIGSMKKSSAIIEENVCFENFYAGIGHDDASPLVTGNVCYANIRAGIGISEHSKPTVRGNKCYKNRRAGIGIRTGEETTPLVEDNECYENKMSGIGCRSESAPVIRNNRCWDNEMAGIGSQDGARPIIVGNECFGNLMAGIGAEKGAVAIIRDNKCYKNLMVGIGVRKGAKALIVENECRENGQAGIGVREEATALIFDNKCLENKLVAIGVRSRSTAHIGRNLLARTGGMPPIVAVREDSSAVIADNTIKGGGVAGVLVEGTAEIRGNQFQGNGPRGGPGPPNYAAWVRGGSTVSFCNNRTDRWRHALYAAGAKSVRATDNTSSNFLGTAIVVSKSETPAHVFGNIAISDSQKDKAASVEGSQGVVAENVRRALGKPN